MADVHADWVHVAVPTLKEQLHTELHGFTAQMRDAVGQLRHVVLQHAALMRCAGERGQQLREVRAAVLQHSQRFHRVMAGLMQAMRGRVVEVVSSLHLFPELQRELEMMQFVGEPPGGRCVVEEGQHLNVAASGASNSESSAEGKPDDGPMQGTSFHALSDASGLRDEEDCETTEAEWGHGDAHACVAASDSGKGQIEALDVPDWTEESLEMCDDEEDEDIVQLYSPVKDRRGEDPAWEEVEMLISFREVLAMLGESAEFCCRDCLWAEGLDQERAVLALQRGGSRVDLLRAALQQKMGAGIMRWLCRRGSCRTVLVASVLFGVAGTVLSVLAGLGPVLSWLVGTYSAAFSRRVTQAFLDWAKPAYHLQMVQKFETLVLTRPRDLRRLMASLRAVNAARGEWDSLLTSECAICLENFREQELIVRNAADADCARRHAIHWTCYVAFRECLVRQRRQCTCPYCRKPFWDVSRQVL